MSHFSDGYVGKYTILHEIGHQIATNRAGGSDRSSGTALTGTEVDGCDGGSMLTKKRQSSAINQGLAHFYAAITWNDRGDGDCVYQTDNDLDFDLTGSGEIVAGADIECFGDPDEVPAPDFTDGEDWLGDLMTFNDSLDCGEGAYGLNTNVSTSYDWLQYLYHLWSTLPRGSASTSTFTTSV